MVDSNTRAAEPAELHEGSDPKLKPIVRFAVILAALSIGSFYAMYRMFGDEMSARNAIDAPLPPLAEARQIPPEPRLESLPGVQLPERSNAPVPATTIGDALPPDVQPFTSSSFAEFDRRQRDELSSYGWIDRQAGVVHIPIDEAMRLTLKKGLPAVEPKSK